MLFFVPIVDFLAYFLIKALQISLSQSVVCQKLLDFVVNILGNSRLSAILKLEFINEESLELLSLLDFLKALSPDIGHS